MISLSCKLFTFFLLFSKYNIQHHDYYYTTNLSCKDTSFFKKTKYRRRNRGGHGGRKKTRGERVMGWLEVMRIFQLPLFVFIIIVACMVSTVIHTGLTCYLMFYIFLCSFCISQSSEKLVQKVYWFSICIHVIFCWQDD